MQQNMQRQKSITNSFTPSLRNMESQHKPLVVLRCKLVVVGDACVGKTAITQVFQSGAKAFPKNYMMTIGAEFSVKSVPFPDKNAVVEFYIFDCAGQSIFNQIEMNSKYFDGASAVLVVYDVGSLESLQSCAKWVAATRESRQGASLLEGVLLGNKSDYRDGTSDSRAEVVREDAVRLAQELKLTHFECSALGNTNIEEPFKFLAEQFYERYNNTVKRADSLSSLST
mmetsp:Transcript_8884/g.8964  ORF Transcript_8884/g.8964 Transcript_8884/m.8964 type:complete len:227 (-) Transcript_8884:1020-1700(-)|eukprot:CAMPEP_0182429282 /NCGR_PEP_ID=MMETSP1167-20130531/25651_1 /TAXON_ID=2988 /ORGANISM="Mallomonas Sp, Strain CCMP3275" /LENGTH=226 /DNA_ID=CAMNT_0024612705 /DNA_START=86 /DNA_END=766 /DNA_ORIENTATION=-